MPDPILEFINVSAAHDAVYDAGLERVTFSLNPGDYALILFDRHAPRTPLADAAMGVIEPTGGEVRFLGDDWRHLSPARAAARRGKIGRLFAGLGWIYNLDVDENVTLRERHHTHRPMRDVEREARQLAEQFGLSELPSRRPAGVPPRDLQRAACARMMMGEPMLTIVDEPAAGLHPDLHDPLDRFLTAERRRGAAVLRLTADPLIWEDETNEPTQRFELMGPVLDSFDTPAVDVPMNRAELDAGETSV